MDTQLASIYEISACGFPGVNGRYYRHSNDHYHKEGDAAFVLLKSPSGLWAVHREGRAVCTAEVKAFLPHKVRWRYYNGGVAGFLPSDMILKKASSLFPKDETTTASEFFPRTRQICSPPSHTSNNRESPSLGQSQTERKASVKVMDDEEVEPRVDKYSKITAGISCVVNVFNSTVFVNYYLAPKTPEPGPADPIDSVLVGECDIVVSQFVHVPAFRDAIQQRDELQRELAALNSAKTNFREIARVGTAHRVAVAAVLQLPLSEEDHLTLADRHAVLVKNLTTTCEELADAEDYDAVTVLGDKLNELKALDVSTLPPSGSCHTSVPSAAHVQASRSGDASSGVAMACEALLTQFTNAPRTREAMLHRDELQNTLTALRAAKSDFAAVGQVGKALKAANAELAQLPLSEEDYLALADRHAALVQKVTAACTALADAGEYDALDALAIKLEELQALDVSALPQPWANDPVQPPAPPALTATAEKGEDDGANDPVYEPPALGASQQGTVPPACTTIPPAAEEGDVEWANDPVYVPPGADETTLA
jgi:hypothetical protein